MRRHMLKTIALIFSIFALARMSFVNPGSPTIISVSTSLNQVIAPRGSIEGGTMIYIKGTNFSPNPGQNLITVGPYPCIIPSDGSKEDTLSCMTTPATDPTKLRALKVTVTVGDVFVGCNSNNCAFTYTSTLTPFIDEIIPRSVVGGDSVYIYGSHIISNLGDSKSFGDTDISYIQIGDRTCSLIDVIQNQDGYNPNYRSAIQCLADKTQVAGQYTFTQLVTVGFAKKSVRTFQTSYFTDKNYTQRILAQVSSLSSYQGGSKGQILTVKGSGFSSDLTDYSCKVAGQICQVFSASLTEVSVQIPALSESNTAYGALSQDSTDSTIQQGMYLGSNGILYKRYSRGNAFRTASDWLRYFRGPVSLDLQEQRILTQLSSPQAYGQNYIEYVKGYFHAPIDGQYRFSLVADDDFAMVMSTVKNNANISNLQNLLIQQSYNANHFISYVRTNVTQSDKNITLTTGYYYFELVLVNYAVFGYFKVLVDLPSLRQYTINPTWQIDRIIIKPSQFTPQTIKVKVMAASGRFDLFYYDSNNILRITTINVGSSANTFREKLGGLPNIWGYGPIVTLILLDESGNPTSNSSLVQGYEYTIIINRYRPPTSLPNSRSTALVAGPVPASITITLVTAHSPPLSGTFSMLANNVPIPLDSGSVNFPYNVRASTIAYYLNKLYNTNEIQAYTVMDTQSQNSNEIVIQYVGLTAPAYTITIDTTLLTGGNEGTTPQGTVQILRDYSNRQLYSPIPYDFLYVASSTPTLQLTVNSIPVVCNNCSYVYNSAITPIINSATRQGRNYTIQISYPSSNNITLSDITVTILQVNCLSLSGSILNFTCSLPINSDSSVALPAGTGKPQVHINQLGFAINTAVVSQNIPITVTSFSPAQTSPGGGIQATIIGTGFPITPTDDLSIIVCDNPVKQFITVSNQRIIFTIPPEQNSCSGSNNQITYNGQTATFSFAYNPSIAPQITALSKTSSSPILKSTINITGSNFNTGTTNVYLMQNGKKKYELSIITINSTFIYCILGGGRSGNYDVIVQDSANGQSIVHENTVFSYKIVINNLSLSEGHKGGGYNLTINGFNFATSAGTNNVFIGDAQNSICKILSYTSTSIVCQVPRMMNDYTTGQQLNVVVTGRIIEQSVCQGNCLFTYVDSGASIIIVPNVTTFKFRDIVQVSGSGLTGAIVSVGGIVCNTNATDNLITFAYPALASNQYQVVIQVSNGWTYPSFISNTVLSFDSAAVSNIPYTGIQLKINGNGLPATGIDAWFVCSSTNQLTILSVNATTIYVRIPSYFGEASCRVNITAGTTSRLFTVNYRTDVTCAGTISGSGLSYTFIKTNMTSTYNPDKIQFVWMDSAGNPTTSKYLMNFNGSTISTSYLPAGIYQVSIHSSTHGFAAVTPSTITINFPTDPTTVFVTSSFAGGKQLVLNGSGFVTNRPQNNQITICGLPSKIITANQTSVTIQTPPLVTTTTQSLYSLSKNSLLQGLAFGDQSFATYIKDNSFNTIYSSSNTVCFVGINFGDNTYADISKIRYVPNPKWIIAAVKLQGAVFQGSNDGINYSNIFEIDTSQVHSGWNIWQTLSSVQYQYVRFKHNSTSGCQLAQLQVYGILYSRITVASGVDKTCDVIVKTGNKLIENAVTYSHAATSVITSINPSFGPSTGGTLIRIQGSGFGTSATVVVKIDGIDCSLTNQTNTQIYCTTGVRANPPTTGNTFSVISNGNNAKIACQPYLYVDRWSNTNTWGGEAVPRQGDSVYVPKGMTLLVDQSTPILDTVIVQGKIQFEDVQALTFDAHYIVINNGQFQAGTQTRRFQNKLTITLYGGYYDKQLPVLGNKVLGCRNCKFNMHGKQRPVTWTQVKSTISPGDIKFTVITPVDWVTGQKIAVAATSFDHYQTEQMEILSVSTNGLQITVTKPFKYRHYAATQTFGSQNFVMRAEVGLLTRNIVVQGDPTSIDSQYGSHLMLTGKQANGLVGKISYAQFTHCGQPKIVGRYCTHFHMAGQVPDSYIRGISVHHSFARVLTIHGTHYLLVEKNVGYYVKGHNIFIQDGIQTKNVIQDNLMMSSITSMIMLQSDITVASYWITNPSNTVRRNHAAGGDFYGFWYEIKQHPDGPSATSDICPMGMPLGISEDNVAHSNKRFGLRIFKLSARKYPCITTMDQSLEDPYIVNPPILSVFQNFTLWKNQECGFLGEQLGYTTIRNFRTIDSRKGGIQFHKTNYTKQLVTAENILVVGYSSGNAPADINSDYDKARGVIASRTDGLKFSGIRFYNFGSTMTPLQSCSQCWNYKLWVTGGKTTLFQNISYYNIQGKYIFWQKWRRQIFIDLDGTLTRPFQTAITPAITTQSKAVISPYRPSLMLPGHCYTVTNDLWDNSVFCDQTVTMRGILFTNGIPSIDFNAIDIKTNLMASPTENVTSQTQSNFSSQSMIIIKKSKDIPNSWAMPFITNQYYNVHWKWGIDFTHMAIAPSRLWEPNEGVVLRFNYSDQRQLFQIAKWYKQQIQLPYIVPRQTLIDPASCQNAEYYHDLINKYLYVCVSGRNKKIREWIDLNGIRCLNYCPTSNTTIQRQSFIRLWSNATQWPNQTLPVANQNLTIPYQWNLILDIDPPILKYVEINGILIFDRSRDNKFQAYYIWVKQGIIQIGTSANPFTKKANIILHGAKDDNYLVIDPDASGNKMLAVTGGLEFYGIEPQTAWTKLTQTASINSTQIKVISANGWSVGDEIVIAPSYAGRKQFQKVTIVSINGNTVSFTPPLTYQHYGSATITIQNAYGVLDTRAAVGLLTRNIKITAGPDPNNWGCRILVYGYNQINKDITIPPVWRNGYAKLRGVQVSGCGQYDTTLAALRIENIGSKQNTNNITTEVQNSAIHGCGGFCTFIKQASNVNINNNVYFWARKFLVYVQEIIGQYNFTNNLLVGARKRDQINNTDETHLVDDVAAYQQYFTINFANNDVRVTNNLVQGSEGQGFVFPATTCDMLDRYPFVNNTAGSCQVAFMYEKQDGKTCLAAKGCIGYASQIGLMANMPGTHTQVIYSDMFFADNERGVTLRYAHQIDDNTLIFKNSYITGISRPNCPNCYGPNKINYCQGGYAIRMFTATITGETFPLKKKPTGHDVICTQQSFDFKAFLNNVTFENYLYNNTLIPYCSKMAVFKRHSGASDGTASHHLTSTKCINCDKQSWAYFDKPDLAWRGWFGGCNELDCTGPNNYLIYDQDGNFTGKKSQILSNNSIIGDNQQFCTFIPQINGHWCNTQQLAVLQYESIASDFNKRKMWPVYLKYDGGSWTTTTNAWKEWQWDGAEPMNLRLARFWSVIKLHQTYNLTYSSQAPSDSRFQIQKRLLPSGNSSDWAIIKIYYPLPNSIQVLVKNSSGTDILVKPYPIRSGVSVNLKTKTNECGANNFYFENGTIQFVVNGVNNCQVRVRLSSFIQLSARLNIPISDFYTNNGLTSFITNICAFLKIDTGRLKIIGVRQGSTIVDAIIQTPTPAAIINQSQPIISNTTAQLADLNNLALKLSEGLKSEAIQLGGQLLNYSADTHVSYECGDGVKAANQQCDNRNKPGCVDCQIVPGYACIHNLYSLSQCYEVCGDGILTATEECDTGKKAGCDANCKIIPGFTCTGSIGSSSNCSIRCGDGIFGGNQKCDNGGNLGCSINCLPDRGYTCKNKIGLPSNCSPKCGDYLRTPSQQCDNGKKTGCFNCIVPDTGYRCIGSVGVASTCIAICGDSIRLPGQICDNGNKPGCSTNCRPDIGYTCTGEVGVASTCSTTCGDLIKAAVQQCDNGNKTGCINCKVDAGYQCKLSQNRRTSYCRKI